KGGVAIIMAAAEYIISHKEIPHGQISIAFTPDEEIGAGTDFFELDKFDADVAYTIDGGKLGEIEYENFNAACAKIVVNGKSFHPGDSKGKMVNASLLLSELIEMLPKNQTPATTEGYEGFYYLENIVGECSVAKASILVRDHDREKFEAKKKFIESVVEKLNAKYGKGTVECQIADTYYNMKEQILPHIYLIENAKKAMETCGVTPLVVPIRGGTDGARLSYMGLPCPNLSTGGHNFHGNQEYVPTKSLEKMVEVVVELIKMQEKTK
ncbi:MAG: peptidase T, partial [Clostridia bacterium]